MVSSKLKAAANGRYSQVEKEGVAVITHAIRKGSLRGHSAALRSFLPVEADPADWAEQQQSVPLPDDEYPHARGDHRVW